MKRRSVPQAALIFLTALPAVSLSTLYPLPSTPTAWAAETKGPESLGITGGAEEPASPPGTAGETPKEKSTQAAAKEKLKTVVSLAVTSADLRNVLSGLAKTYGLNIVADESVKGTVNVTLQEVTLEEALKQVLEPAGFIFVWEDSILKIVSREEAVTSEMLPLRWIQSDLALEFLKQEASESGVMKADDVQGGILVTDKISNVDEMKKILKKIDIPPQQVLIQAKLLDITHTDQDNLGLKLSSVSFDLPLRASLGQALLNITGGSLDLSGPSSDLTTDTIAATISKGSETLTATLDALIRDKRVKVLATPTVTTLNNVEAKITIGEKFPIQETTQTTTGTLQTTRFVDVGITLRVTPKINREGYIQMQIHPEVSSVSSTITAGPRITTREADTTIIVKDRESVVIAGLVKEEETFVRDRIPILGHIPLFGVIFTNRSKSYEQKELVIVITPYLMPVEPPQRAEGSEAQEIERRLYPLEMYRQARDFEAGKTLQARDMPSAVRLLRAVEIYEQIAEKFPGHTLTPEALWRAADLSWDSFQDGARAEGLLNRLTARYPAHSLAEKAQRQIQWIRNHRTRRMRRVAREQARSASEAPGPSGPMMGEMGRKRRARAEKTAPERASPGKSASSQDAAVVGGFR